MRLIERVDNVFAQFLPSSLPITQVIASRAITLLLLSAAALLFVPFPPIEMHLSWIPALKLMFLSGLAILVMSLVLSSFTPTDRETIEEEMQTDAKASSLDVLLAGLIASFSEEYFFRGILFLNFGYAISSCVYLLFSDHDHWSEIAAGVFSSCVSCYLATHGLLVPMMFHFGFCMLGQAMVLVNADLID